MSKMFQSDQETRTNIVPQEIIDGLDAASKYGVVQFMPLAAENACIVIKLLQHSKVIDEHVIRLVNRAAKIVVDAYNECNRLIDSDLDIPQTMEDNARKLAGLFYDLERECNQSRKKRIGPKIMGQKPRSIKKMNRWLDDLSIFQTNSILDVDESKHPSCKKTPRIAANGRDIAVVLNSGEDRIVTTFVDSSGQATTGVSDTSSSNTNHVLESLPRVQIANADSVLVVDSGNNETFRTYFPMGSSASSQENSAQFREKAFQVFSQLAQLEDTDIPSYARERIARCFSVSTSLSPQ